MTRKTTADLYRISTCFLAQRVPSGENGYMATWWDWCQAQPAAPEYERVAREDGNAT